MSTTRAVGEELDEYNQAIMVWTGEDQGFAIRANFENNKSLIVTQRAFSEGSLFRQKTLFLIQTIFKCGLSELEETVRTL